MMEASSPRGPPSGPLREGLLKKKSAGVGKLLQKRWHVVYRTGLVAWYKESVKPDSSINPRGSVRLAGCTVFSPPGSDSFALQASKHDLPKTYTWKANSIEDRDGWVAAFLAAGARLHNGNAIPQPILSTFATPESQTQQQPPPQQPLPPSRQQQSDAPIPHTTMRPILPHVMQTATPEPTIRKASSPSTIPSLPGLKRPSPPSTILPRVVPPPRSSPPLSPRSDQPQPTPQETHTNNNGNAPGTMRGSLIQQHSKKPLPVPTTRGTTTPTHAVTPPARPPPAIPPPASTPPSSPRLIQPVLVQQPPPQPVAVLLPMLEESLPAPPPVVPEAERQPTPPIPAAESPEKEMDENGLDHDDEQIDEETISPTDPIKSSTPPPRPDRSLRPSTSYDAEKRERRRSKTDLVVKRPPRAAPTRPKEPSTPQQERGGVKQPPLEKKPFPKIVNIAVPVPPPKEALASALKPHQTYSGPSTHNRPTVADYTWEN